MRAPALRSNVGNTVSFQTLRPAFYAYYTSGGTLGSGSHALPLSTEFIDSWNGHSTTTNPSQYFCQLPGWYLCKMAIGLDYVSSTQEQFGAALQGVSLGSAFGPNYGPMLLNGSTLALAPYVADLIPMSVTGAIGGSGDYIEAIGVNNSGGSVTIVQNFGTGYYPFVTMRWVADYVTEYPSPLPAAPPLGTWPVPPSYVTATFLNENIRDTVRYLLSPPVARMYVTGTHALPSQTWPAATIVPLNTSSVDNYGGFSSSSNNYTAPYAGNYFVYGQINLVAAASGTAYGMGFSVNGGTVQYAGVVSKLSDSTGGGVGGQTRLRLNQGDTVAMYATQASGSSINYATAAGVNTLMLVVWEGL